MFDDITNVNIPAPVVVIQSLNIDRELVGELWKCLGWMDGGPGTEYARRGLECNVSASFVNRLRLEQDDGILQLGIVLTRAKTVSKALHVKGQRRKEPAHFKCLLELKLCSRQTYSLQV